MVEPWLHTAEKASEEEAVAERTDPERTIYSRTASGFLTKEEREMEGKGGERTLDAS